MSNLAFSSKDGPHVEHSFDGDVRILNATFDRRLEIRKALTALAQELQRVEGQPVQIKADIQLNISSATPTQHIYAVNVTDPGFDEEALSRQSPSRESRVHHAPTQKAHTSAETYNNGARRPSLGRPMSSTSGLNQEHHHRGDDPIDVRPCKRPRSDLVNTSDLANTLDLSTTSTATKLDELLTYIKAWHNEWTSQGGWLFDTLTKTQPSLLSEHQLQLERKMDVVQDVLGQSLNSASAAAMAELDNISKLVPWLEHCRKASADKIQAREEKWRTSSANFHDEARRDREKAESRLQGVVAEHGALLAKIARAVGVRVDEGGGGRSPEEATSREGLLGAQLRRELSLNSAQSSVGEGGRRWSRSFAAAGNHEAIAGE